MQCLSAVTARAFLKTIVRVEGRPVVGRDQGAAGGGGQVIVCRRDVCMRHGLAASSLDVALKARELRTKP